jgi:hypothetical protein
MMADPTESGQPEKAPKKEPRHGPVYIIINKILAALIRSKTE